MWHTDTGVKSLPKAGDLAYLQRKGYCAVQYFGPPGVSSPAVPLLGVSGMGAYKVSQISQDLGEKHHVGLPIGVGLLIQGTFGTPSRCTWSQKLL